MEYKNSFSKMGLEIRYSKNNYIIDMEKNCNKENVDIFH
jgi:hypothetical protein